ncbi:uncharacterized protein LOC131067335 [Cryptomeria japonica]|uniref:uncharacterized protein LOC131067335 n=1 Tax=Cryptomeria japonica TaxID=3369 RepID=UPI0027DA046B|nr:uncharacterized protein LOC131067335 [Cryptomeria japonica]
MDFAFGKDDVVDGRHDAERALKFIQKVQAIRQAVEAQLEQSQAKYKAYHDKHRIDHHFQVGDCVWLHISKERMQGEGKKLKPIRYGPFEILEKIGTNAFRLNLPPYMQIYSVVNVENLKLYKLPMIFDEEANIQVPSVDDLAPDYMLELLEDVILDRNIRSSKRGGVEYLKVGRKGMHPGKARWMEIGKVRELFPHLLSE